VSKITNIQRWPRRAAHHKIDTDGYETYEVQVDGNTTVGYLIAVHPLQVENWDRDIVDTGLVENQGPNKPPTSKYVFRVEVEAESEEGARDRLVDGVDPDEADEAELEEVL
jgi:hypothetical protein